MRAVFDTNVLISAFVFPGGAPESAYRAALSGRVTLVTSPPLLAGLARVLADRFGWEEAMVETPVRQVARIGTVVRPADTLSMIEQDPNDDRVLALGRLSRHHRVGRPSPLRARVVGRDPDHPRHSTSTIPGKPTSAHTPRELFPQVREGYRIPLA